MNTQPEALRLAQMFDGLKFTVVGLQNALPMEEAAAELRRLHEENTALRQTIEYAKKQEHHPWCDYLNIMLTSLPPQKAKCNCKQAQPEQEPVCDKDPYLCGFVQCQLGKACKNTLINTIPTKIFGPNLEQILNAAGFYKRQWVGLTEDEIRNGQAEGEARSFRSAVQWAETKLKERNT